MTFLNVILVLMLASPRTSLDSYLRPYAFSYLCVLYFDSLFSSSCLEPCIPMQGLERIFASVSFYSTCATYNRQDDLRVISMTTVSSTANFTPYLLLISYVLLLLLYHLIAVCRVLSVFEKACLASVSTFVFPVSVVFVFTDGRV
ncbi:hypothetical protein BDV38DRAFT_189434 [Aspergillus pseudotamarii]|uniref:Uncharacterized protein n=1 Tax=Aspergillus pseudotamarii TaxID=132259 RepID=A0A5N6T5J5_ASPPS|nr:uncharacterized protein BDV38DRAFT_189434 [Aspergillus pseudotamarii]KAE8141560.1 hypothetical protein BDV38DRAFT_189434 [Aspergillus pseudotamarii]